MPDETPIEDVVWPDKIRDRMKYLIEDGYRTVGDLRRATNEELKRTPNITGFTIAIMRTVI